jgi:hypothetical protein
VVRDQKLSFTHAADGIFHKAQLYSSYLWAANKRPYGTGLVGDQKRRLLMVFLACESQDGPYFQKYGPKIAEDFGRPFNTDDEKLVVWKEVEELGSCNQSGDTAKLSRWFSWNSIAHVRMKEFHCEKMLLEHHLDSAIADPDDNPIKFTEIERLAVKSSSIVGQLNAIKRAAGGLKLAYMLMSSWLLDVCKIMYIVLLASWTWYSFHVKNIKSPSDNVRYTIRMSKGAWARDGHLFHTIEESFFSAKNLAFMGISTYDKSAQKQQKIDMEVDLVIHLVSNRAWSLAARHAIPPDTYSLAISSDPAQRQLGVDELQGDFRRLLKLEDSRCRDADAMLLWKEMITPKKFPIRLIYLFYERDAYDPSSSCGIRWMMGHVKIMPDNKVVEDCHNDIRRCANSNPNPVLSTGNMQRLVNNSGVLDKRNIAHPAKLTKDIWQQKYKGASSKTKQGRVYNSHRHSMGPTWANIMHTKTWHTVGEPQLRLDAAAWNWLHVGSGIDTQQPKPLGSARFSKLMMIGFLVRDTSTDSDDDVADDTRHQWYISLDNAMWGALAWPLKKYRDGVWMWNRDHSRGVEWVHVTTPSTWISCMYRGIQDDGGIFLEQQGPPEPLLKAVLRKKHNLNFDDLLRLLPAYGLTAESSYPNRKDLLMQLALHVGDEAFAAEALMIDKAPDKKPVTLLTEDPLFNLAYDEMDPDDQQEYKEVKDARHRGKVRKCMDAVKAQVAKRTRRANAKAKAKAMPKAKAEARPPPVEEVPPPVAAPPPLADLPLEIGPVAAPLVAAAVPPLPPPLAPAPLGPRDDRALTWGTSWVLAEVHSQGILTAWSARCLLHGGNCNKSLNMGSQFTPEVAKRRIQEWCIRGLDVAVGLNARTEHMDIKPRFFPSAEVRSSEELTGIAHMPR